MRILLSVSVLLVLLSPLAAQKDLKPLTEDERIHHALSRLSFGPTPGQFGAVRAQGLEAWVTEQLEGTPDEKTDTRARELFKTLGSSPKEQAAMAEGSDDMMSMGSIGDVRFRSMRELRRSIVFRGVSSKSQLRELMADFWRNHFNVDVAKNSVQWTATHYEEHVIRKHLFGKFQDMLWDTAHHPAMLVYLDNSISRRPPSKSELKQIERRFRRRGSSREEAREQAEIAKQRGLNENYARELMELHTLGVDRDYTQEDVEQVALAFTGWSVDFDNEDEAGFSYRENMHDPRKKKVLGKNVPRGRREEGIIEGRYILKMLAGHKNTAEFVATKMVRYLVNDHPPADIVKRAAEAYRKSKGDLAETVKSIVLHPSFYDRGHYRAKFKTPLEFVISACRATGAEVTDTEQLVQTISDLGMPIYGCEDPTGYRDTAESWRDPGVMALRWKFAIDLARGRIKGAKVPESFYYRLPEDPLELMESLMNRVVPHGLDENTYAVLERVIFKRVQDGKTKTPKDRRDLAETIIGILIGSPEFQQQ